MWDGPGLSHLGQRRGEAGTVSRKRNVPPFQAARGDYSRSAAMAVNLM